MEAEIWVRSYVQSSVLNSTQTGPSLGRRLLPSLAALFLLAGCQENVAIPDDWQPTEGETCSYDLTSARRMGDEALMTAICDFTPNSEVNRRLLGTLANKHPFLSTTITRRFDCGQRRIVETTVTIIQKDYPTKTRTTNETMPVIPNSPNEQGLNFACSK